MDSKKDISENFSEGFEADVKSSIDDFLRELEEKEKDLNISQEVIIEIEESTETADELPEFIKADLAAENAPPVEKSVVAPAPPPVGPAVHAAVQNPDQAKRIAELENQVNELKMALQRRQMDFDNYRKRIERERGDTFQNQLSNLATQMLPVLDNLDRALDAAAHFEGEQSSDFRQFFDGIALVNQQLNEVLQEMGVQPVVTVGKPFNPHFHEAVATEATNEYPPNTITEELLRGYRLGDRLIRAAMVKVASPAE
jgi:molecular chaperone GrpE